MALKDARIVELGCGDGSLLMEVANALSAREVYFVNIDKVDFKKAADRRLRIFKADLNNDSLSFKDSSFDVVLMEEVIEHLINPDNAIREAYHVLKAGAVSASNHKSCMWLNRLALLLGYQPYWNEFSTIYNVGKFKRNQVQLLSGHLQLYTYRALKQLLQLHGFKVIVSKGFTYNNLPTSVKQLDNLMSKMPGSAQIVIILARK